MSTVEKMKHQTTIAANAISHSISESLPKVGLENTLPLVPFD